MASEHKFAWTRKWVILNTLATIAGAGSGLAALVVLAIVALAS